MTAIFKRELRSYFTSPIGYVFLGITLLVSGIFFVYSNLYRTVKDMSDFFNDLTLIFVLLLPLLTMRLFTEDKKNKTDQLLLTAPVTVTKIVVGKYLSAVVLFGFALVIMLIYPFVMLLYGKINLLPIFALYLGFFLAGASLISIGVFISATTESQIIAAVITFITIFGIMISGWIASVFNYPFIRYAVDWFSVFKRFTEFTAGVLSLSSVVYFLSFSAVFIYLTVLSIEKKRWS
ncbi:MAG: Inner membrane transport permease YbhR [Firmicutes bacterium ADurb.Bin193]|nr:MAG: Inner membrane transport permease YbhR [Firmicutes bacterium ADurb.Bin193]